MLPKCNRSNKSAASKHRQNRKNQMATTSYKSSTTKYGTKKRRDHDKPWRVICSLSRSDLLTASKVPLGHIRQLPLAQLACRSRASRTDATINHLGAALPIAVGSVVVREGVRCALTRCEKGGSGSACVGLFWVVADWAGTLISAGVATVEECFAARKSQCASMGGRKADGTEDVRILQPVTATPEQEHEMGIEKPST